MINILSLKLGRYIVYELCGPVQSCYHVFDSNVRIVTEFDQIKDNSLGIQQDNFERLLKNKTNLFVYFERGVPSGMMWGHIGGCYIRGPGIPLLLDEKSVYWFWIYTLPQARGKNIYKKLKTAFFHHYKGYNCFTALVDPCNTFMRCEMSKIGFIEAKYYFFVKFGSTSVLFERCNVDNKCNLRFEKGNKHDLPFI